MIALIASLILTIPAPMQATVSERPMIAACKYEDGSGQRLCVWDGHHHGNGIGKSFIVRRWGKHLQHERFVYV